VLGNCRCEVISILQQSSSRRNHYLFLSCECGAPMVKNISLYYFDAFCFTIMVLDGNISLMQGCLGGPVIDT
jgi:hypothetical protein